MPHLDEAAAQGHKEEHNAVDAGGNGQAQHGVQQLARKTQAYDEEKLVEVFHVINVANVTVSVARRDAQRDAAWCGHAVAGRVWRA